MNIRKNVDYSDMYEALDNLMAKDLPQMELYCEIGRAVCRRTEKGAAVMASEYLNKNYPDIKGFSPRNLRRMRDFYRTYENHPSLLSRALKLGWIQNVVIMEADLTLELREWYINAGNQFGWSKAELTDKIVDQAYLEIVLEIDQIAYGSEIILQFRKEYICDIILIYVSLPKQHRSIVQRCRGKPSMKNNIYMDSFEEEHIPS